MKSRIGGRPLLPVPQDIGQPAMVLISASGLLALCAGLFAALPVFRDHPPAVSHWLRAALAVVDPNVVQLLALLHCLFCVEAWRRSTEREAPFGRALQPTISVLLMFLVYYALNDLVFKRAFDRARPDISYRAVVDLVGRYFGPSVQGAPSGFASRGVFLALTSALAVLALPRDAVDIPKPLGNLRWVLLIQVAALVVVSASRVLSGLHFAFDVLLGVSLGTYVYWFLSLLLGTFSSLRNDIHHASLVSVTFSLLIGIFIIGLTYSRDADAWAPAILGALVAVVAILRGPRRQVSP